MATDVKPNSALVLHSGGQDSTTCLAWALDKYDDVKVVSFDYGQRHKIEIESAKKIADHLNLEHKVIEIDLFKELTNNALVNHSAEVAEGADGELPTTFVDGRNIVFLTTAAIYAKQMGIPNIVTGVCQTDYSGYPDCRDEFIKSLNETLKLGMEFPFEIHTPLMFLTKAETVKLIDELGKLDLMKYTHTCYEGKSPACGKCPACKLRLKGFEEAGTQDPIDYE